MSMEPDIDNNSLESRVRREQEAHDEHDVLERSRRLKRRFPHIEQYPSRVKLYERMDGYLSSLEGRRVLEVGCGDGERCLTWLDRGATVAGIDISEQAIETARRRSSKSGFPDDRYSFRVMDAHRMGFADGEFDIVVGYGVLHHLDVSLVLPELHRVLRRGGRALFQEPLADSPLLKLFRALTPRARTADERPFSRRDLDRILASDEWSGELFYCGLVSAPVAILTSIALRPWPSNVLLQLADWLEARLNKRHVLTGWNQYVCINLIRL